MKANCLRVIIVTVFIFILKLSQAQSTPPPVPDASLNAIEDSTKVFEKVEVEAMVNIAQWRQHLMKELVPYVEKAAKKKMKAGIYTVNVRFLVEKDGNISDVKALNDPGFGLAQGAEKVVKTGPKWIPGELNGRTVRSYLTQPIFFQITE